MTLNRKIIAAVAAVFLTLSILSQNAFAVIETINYSYDEQGRVQNINYGNGFEDEYVYDAIGNRSSKTLSLNGSAQNQPPNVPNSPSPGDGAISVQYSALLQWSGGDPNQADSVTYEVYLGTTPTPPLYKDGIPVSEISTGSLEPNTVYYWKIISRDNFNATSQSAVWSFTTGNSDPTTPTNPNPRDNSSVVNDNVYLSWIATDPDVMDHLEFDVYFGTSSSPPLLFQNLTSPYCDIDAQLTEGTYYWKVVAKDTSGATTESPVWSFQAVDQDPVVYGSFTINTDTTFTKQGGPYIIEGMLSVASGVSLTIEPGTIIKVGPDATILVYGSLIAQGTESQKIVFTSYRDDSYGGDTNGDWNGTSPAKGDWSYISYGSSCQNCVLSHVIVRYGGDTVNYGVIFSQSDLDLDHVTIEDSAGDGLYLMQGSFSINESEIVRCDRRGVSVINGEAQITSSHFEDNLDYDIYSTSNLVVQNNTIHHGIYVSAVQNQILLSGNTISYDNLFPLRLPADTIGEALTNNTIINTDDISPLIVLGQTITKDAVWPDTFLYQIESNIIIQGDDGDDQLTTLNISAGTELRFRSAAGMQVGAGSGAHGALIAAGTPQLPIRFGPEDQTPGLNYWGGIQFYDTADEATTLLQNCSIQQVGNSISSKAVHIQNSSPSIIQCSIADSKGTGIYVSSGSPQIVGSSIYNCGNYGIQVTTGAIQVDGNYLSDNGNYDLYFSSGGALVDNNTLHSGLYVSNGQLASLNNNTFHYNNTFPVHLIADDIGALMTDNTIADATSESYLEVASGTISHDAVWPSTITYHILGNITVKGRDGADDNITTLTLGAGAELKFNLFTNFYIGASSGDPGALVAEGTSENPIVFTSNQATPAAGDWYGLTFYNTADDATTRLVHCIVEYAGKGTSGRAIYIVYAAPTINNCTIRYSQGDGIYAQGGGPQISENTISNCGRYGINLASSAATISENNFVAISNYDLYMSNGTGASVINNTMHRGLYVSTGQLAQLSGNNLVYDDSHPIRLFADDVGAFFNANTISNLSGDSYLEVTMGTISHDAVWPSTIAYHIMGSITVKGRDGADDNLTTLTLGAGAELRFNQFTYFYIGAPSGDPGALVAEGTSENPIVFTSNQATPAAGNWCGLTFYGTADDATTRLVHCIVEYAGYGTSGRAVYIHSSSPVLDYCTLRYSQGYGIHVYAGAPQITNSTISDTLKGIYVQSGTPVIYGNQLTGNSSYGLHNNTTITLLAQDNWWGHLSGPYHPTTNPTGQGDTVSNYVDYDPWLFDNIDMDADGIPDQWEIGYFNDKDTVDDTTDYDADGLSDSNEYAHDTDPTDPDTDDDGISDGDEVTAGTDPLDPMSP